MAVTPSFELNRYSKLKERLKNTIQDISFLKKCQSEEVFPKFISVKFPRRSSARIRKIELKSKKLWLKSEIKTKYALLSNLNILCYNLHLKITKTLNVYADVLMRRTQSLRYGYVGTDNVGSAWCVFNNILECEIDANVRDKKIRQHKKLSWLLHRKYTVEQKPNVVFLEDFIVNESKEVFDQDELNLLNRGLKFAPPAANPPFRDICCGIEASMKTAYDIPYQAKDKFRADIDKILRPIHLDDKRKHMRQDYTKTLTKLSEKDVFYEKSDKGNKVVVLDKEEYHRRVQKMLSEGPYMRIQESQKNTLKNLNDELSRTLSKYCPTFNLLPSSLKFTNPRLATIYGLPKIHKSGEARKNLRPISSSVNYPTERVAKFLVSEFSKLPKPNRRAVKNCFEFAREMNEFQLEEGEVMVSFDVSALFPSVPVDETIELLKNWLERSGVTREKIEAYIEWTKICVKKAFFTYENQVYTQTEGLKMGSSLSPFLAEIFMSKLEEDMSKSSFFPRRWFRYVDDVFCVIKKTHLRRFLMELNAYHPCIKFTYEEEIEGKISFLDVLVIRNSQNKLEFDVYRKETNTMRFITSDSHHSEDHKMAAFNSMIHRLMTLPLSPERYKKEEDYIYEVARVNGYERQTISKLIRKKSQRTQRRQLTTLSEQREKLTKFVTIPFHPRTNNRIKNACRSNGFNLVNKSARKLGDILGNPKDKLRKEDRSGIYRINCGNCDKFYIGQTSRTIETRFKEHLTSFKNRRFEKSAIAQHMSFNKHDVRKENLELLEQVTDRRKLDFLETAHINAANPDLLLNREGGPCNSVLLRYV